MSVTFSYILAVDFGEVDECPATLSTFTPIRVASVTWLKLAFKWGQPIFAVTGCGFAGATYTLWRAIITSKKGMPMFFWALGLCSLSFSLFGNFYVQGLCLTWLCNFGQWQKMRLYSESSSSLPLYFCCLLGDHKSWFDKLLRILVSSEYVCKGLSENFFQWLEDVFKINGRKKNQLW